MALAPDKNSSLINNSLRGPANLCALLFFLAILVPQSTLVGRPRLVLATFVMWFLCSLGSNLVNTIKRVGPLVMLPVIQLGITLAKVYLSGGTIQMLLSGEIMERHMTFLAVPIYLSLVTFLCGFYLLNDPQTLQRLRVWSVIVLGAVTAYALRRVYAEPGVGRILAMHKSIVIERGFNPDALTVQGVPGYAIIYTVAMTVLLLIYFARDARAISRPVCVIYVAAVAVLVTHVIFSLLTLPTIVGEVVLLTGLFFSILYSSLRHRFVLMCGIAIVAFAIHQMDTIKFIENKSTRLVTGMTSQGPEKGDETGRVTRLTKSFNTFREYPLFGCDFRSKTLKEKIGDHSSLVDPLGMFGIFGYIPMILYQFILLLNGLRVWNAHRKELRGIGELGAWVFYGACSFWNPTTYTMLPLALLFLQFLPAPQAELNASSGSGTISKATLKQPDKE